MTKYGAILADPPWLFRNFSEKGAGRNATAHYDCMATDEICAMAIGAAAQGAKVSTGDPV